MNRTRLEWAQWMAAKGISVFIVEPFSKRPLGGNSWYLRQDTNPEQIEAWFNETENANYGLHLGENFVVIDLDLKPQHSGVMEFEKICQENGIDNFLFEIDTLMSKTPSGGYHLYFKAPFPCGLGNDFPEGIDVRGVTGYVVGPGSEDSRGEWAIMDPNAEITELPEFLIDYLRKPGRKDPNQHIPLIDLDLEENVEHAIEWLRHRDPAVQGESGDTWTYITCQFLRDFGVSEEMALIILNDSGWNARCDPPWADAALAVKIENSYSYGENRPGVKAPTYKVERLTSARPEGGWGLTKEQIAEMFHPTRPSLSLAVDNTVDEDSEIPSDVDDDDIDPITGEEVEPKQIWNNVIDFAALPAIREYLLYGWMVTHGICHIIAKRGTGKSTVALDIAFRVALDMDWWGVPVKENFKVIYLCLEDPEGMRLNCRAWMKYHEVNDAGKEQLKDRFLVADDVIKLTDARRLDIRIKEMMQWADGEPCLVVLDTWQRATSGWSRNDQESMDLAVENAERIAKHVNGPMLSCVHPPKDGRMTVVGSGVQEDTSTGIWFLEEVGDGIRLKVDRIKGAGDGNYMKFDIQKIILDGEDSFGKPLEGIVPIKIGGTEDEGKPDAVLELDRELRDWANVIWGCHMFPKENNAFFGIAPKKLNPAQVSEFIAAMWTKSKDIECEDTSDAMDFVNRYMDGISNHVKTMSAGNIEKKLNSLFSVTVPPTVIMGNGLRTMEFEKIDPESKKLKAHRQFKFKDRVKD